MLPTIHHSSSFGGKIQILSSCFIMFPRSARNQFWFSSTPILKGLVICQPSHVLCCLPTDSGPWCTWELAQILLRKFPSESTARSARFLLEMCRQHPLEPLVDLPWLRSDPILAPIINVGIPPALHRLAPVMSFRAQHRR